MNGIDEKHYLTELRYNIKERDLIKAEILVSHFNDIDGKTRIKAIFELRRADDDFALQLLEQVIINHPRLVDITPALLKAFLGKLIKHPKQFIELFQRPEFQKMPDILMAALDELYEKNGSAAAELINTAMNLSVASVRNHALSQLIGMGKSAVSALLPNLTLANNDLVINTLSILGEIGSGKAVKPIGQLLHQEPADANVRFAAYEAIGKLPINKGALLLLNGLDDPESSVAMAAAKAIDNKLDAGLIAGINNSIQSAGRGIGRLVEVIVNSHSYRLFASQLENRVFWKFAVYYLKKEAPEDTRSFFEEQLRINDLGSYADAISPDPGEKEKEPDKVIWVVDDSRMILSAFKVKLHNLGYQAELFDKPLEASERLAHERPDIIFTDLNMPGMTGIDLTQKVRELFTADELPVVMVTTQDEGQDHQDAFKAGVNRILAKPFNEEMLADALAELLTQDANDKSAPAQQSPPVEAAASPT